MTHSHDRTLLASLSFSDPDKREPLHDLACEYLAQPAQSERLVRMSGCSKAAITTQAILEAEISKGDGQYRTTIGFLDLRIDWRTEGEETEKGRVIVEVKVNPISIGDVLRQITLYRGYLEKTGYHPALRNEVNAIQFRARLKALGGSGETLVIDRGNFWVLATVFELSSGETETLRQADITHIRLGGGFEKWFEERQKQPAPKPEEF